MNFQSLTHIEPVERYIDRAMRASAKTASMQREQLKGSEKNRLLRSRQIEVARVDAFSEPILSILYRITREYPNFDELPSFYKELVSCTLDVDKLRKSLGAVNWAHRQIKNMRMNYRKKIKASKALTSFNQMRTSFLGRVCSILRQVKKDFEFLEECRKVMKRFPAIKTSWKTVVIAGVPNVGKSTLLASLTGSKPEVAYYPFTTKNLNFGSDKKNKVQFVDTPGLLDRPLSKRNKIERQAIIALKHIADVIVYVFDPSESCGYSVDEQKSLLREIRRLFGVPTIAVANKSDLGTADLDALPIAAKDGLNIAELKKQVFSRIGLRV